MDKPYYAGSTEVEVAARRTCTAQITAKIGNSQALVRATESFKKYYNNAEFSVTTGAARPATRHIFTLDARKAGSATLTVTLGEGYTETVDLDVELNDEAIE